MGKNSTLNTKKYLLILGDVAILYFSLWLTLIIRYYPHYNSGVWSQHLSPFTAIFIVWLLIFYVDNLYELAYGKGRLDLLGRVLRSVLLGTVFAMIFFYLGQDRLFSIRPQRVLLVDAAISAITIYLWHLIVNAFTKSPKMANGLMIIGFNPQVDEIIREISQRPQFGFQLRSIVASPGTNIIPDNLKEVATYDQFENLKNICIEKKINFIVSTIHPRDNAVLSKSLFDCLPLKVSFFDFATFYEKITGKIPVTTVEQTWFLENLTESGKKTYEGIKRIIDVLLSVLLLILSLILVPFVVLAIKLSDKGPIFFTQVRVGKNGKNFTAIKFRTMKVGAEKNGPQWATKNDPRVTKLGKFLRKTRIDEIPQLINVIKGEMSLVGPRPERPEFVEELQSQIPFYKERLLVKPGLSGWAQVAGPAYGGSKEESLEKLQYDLFYIKNRSFGLDLSIMLKTIRTVLMVRGQ